MEYDEENFLQLSGIQHFIFCRRQWALIHVEGQWAENERTVDGQFFHKKAHDGISTEKRGDTIITRGLYIHSRKLGLSGQCDILEFYRDENGITLNGYSGHWIPFPIEYKRGKKKPDCSDAAQLCAQAICLEEMYCCDVKKGAVFYGTNRRRQQIDFVEELRNRVFQSAEEMHNLYRKGHTPIVKQKKTCDSCSLKGVCLPELESRESVKSYMHRMVQKES